MSNRGDLLRVRARFKETQAKQEPRLDRFLALMGDGQGNLAVPGTPLFVYVRVLGRGVVECLNQVAPLRNDLPLIVGYDFKKPDTLQVLSIYEGGMSSFGPYAYLPAHHQAHEFRNADGGDDVVWIQKQAVIPLLCRPTSPISMFVEILEDNYPWLSGWNLFPGATSAGLAPRVPALPGDARFVLIYVDGATNALGYSNGALFAAAWPPGTAFSLIPAPPAGSVPVVAVYLPNGIAAIDWPNLYDLRLFNQPMGGSVTPGPHALLDSTVHSDTVTNPPTRGSLIVADATPDWSEVVHPGGAGYALITNLNDVIWDRTPLWLDTHSFAKGIIFASAVSGVNFITIPDNLADALHVIDTGAFEYMRVVSTNAQPATVFNFGEEDIDFRVAALGITDALFVQGSTGFVGAGRNTPEGHLDVYDITVNTTISYYGIHNEHVKTLGATDYLDVLEGIYNHIEFDQNGATIGRFTGINNRTILTSGAIGDGGTRDMRGIYNYLWMEDATCTVTEDVLGIHTDIDLNGGTIGVDVLGHYIYMNLRAGLTSIGGDVFGIKLYLDADQDPVGTAYSVYWEEGTNVDYGIYQNGTAPNRLGGHVDPASASGQDLGDATHRWDLYTQDVIFGGATGANVITVPDNIADALGLLDAGGLEYLRIVSTDANPYFLIDPAAAGINTGLGLAAPLHILDVRRVAAATVFFNGGYDVANPSRAQLGTTAWHGRMSLFSSGNVETVRMLAGGNSYLTGGNFGLGIAVPAHLIHVSGNDWAGYWDRAGDYLPGPNFVLRKCRGTIAVPTPVQVNDETFSFRTFGYNNAAFREGAQMQYIVEAVGAAFISSAIVFKTGNNVAAVVERLRIDKDGHVYPAGVKTQDLGLATNEWDDIFYVTANVGTSRLVESTRTCPVCGETMMRGTGTVVIRGETADYALAHCVKCGCVATEEWNHLPAEKESDKRVAPVIILENIRVKVAGRNRQVAVDFRYGNDILGNEGQVIERAVRNSTRLGEKEIPAFLTLETKAERHQYLLALGQREWESREETRLMKEVGASLQAQFNIAITGLRGTDLQA